MVTSLPLSALQFQQAPPSTFLSLAKQSLASGFRRFCEFSIGDNVTHLGAIKGVPGEQVTCREAGRESYVGILHSVKGQSLELQTSYGAENTVALAAPLPAIFPVDRIFFRTDHSEGVFSILEAIYDHSVRSSGRMSGLSRAYSVFKYFPQAGVDRGEIDASSGVSRFVVGEELKINGQSYGTLHSFVLVGDRAFAKDNVQSRFRDIVFQKTSFDAPARRAKV